MADSPAMLIGSVRSTLDLEDPARFWFHSCFGFDFSDKLGKSRLCMTGIFQLV